MSALLGNYHVKYAQLKRPRRAIRAGYGGVSGFIGKFKANYDYGVPCQERNLFGNAKYVNNL